MTSRFKVGVDGPLAEKIVRRLGRHVRMFPKPSDPDEWQDLVETWRDALNVADVAYPPSIYLEAITSWLSQAKSTSFPPFPGDILEHCQIVMSRIDRDPVRGPKMREWREEYRLARIDSMVADDER